MAITVLSNLVDDSDIQASERVIDMAPEIAELEANLTQFTTMLMKVSSKPAFSTKVEWLEDQLFPRLSTLAASATSAAATISVASGEGAFFRKGDIIRVATTGEALAVSAAPATDTVGVVRSWGTTAAASAASGVDLVIIGNASAQGATLGVRKVTKRVAQYNYCQIFRHPFGFTESLAASKLYGGPEPQKEARKKAVEHKRAIEYHLFWGGRDVDTTVFSATEPTFGMGGVLEYCGSNQVKDPSGVMTKTEFENFMRDGLQSGSMNKILFAAPLFKQIISDYARDNWVRSTPGQGLWGISVDGFISGVYGDRVPVVVKRDWNEFQNTSSQYGSWAFLVDMEAVKLRPLRSTKLLNDRQANDADEKTAEYLTEVSFQIEQASPASGLGQHMIIKNATSSV